MCIYVDQRAPRIAKENIPVFKVVYPKGKDYVSCYLKAPYKLNTLYKIEGKCPIPIAHPGIIFHSYLDKGVIHSYTSLSAAQHNHRYKFQMSMLCILTGYIPKGTKYWINEEGTEIASRAAVYTHEVNNESKN